jgi:hypothetical protein
MRLLALFLLAALQPIEDPADVDVCQRVAGTDVAKLFGKDLKQARPSSSKDEFSKCTYLLTTPGSSGAGSGCSIWLYPAKAYDELLEFTEGIQENPTGFGDAAVLFKDEDGLTKLRVLVRGRFAVEAVAADAESAKRLAKLALERLAR